MKNGEFKVVTNHWGWTVKGIKLWIKFGWGFFDSWILRYSNPLRPNRRCTKVGPFVYVRDVKNL